MNEIVKSSRVHMNDFSKYVAEKRFDSIASIYFETRSAELDAADVRVIREAGRLLLDLTQLKVFSGCVARVGVYGYADCRGSSGYNAELGRRRAAAVTKELMDLPVDIFSVSFGEDFSGQVSGSNELAQNLRAEDRRVDIVLQLKSRTDLTAVKLRSIIEEAEKLSLMLQSNDKYKSIREYGPMSYFMVGDTTLEKYRQSVDGLQGFDTRNMPAGEALKEAFYLVLTELPVAMIEILWITFWQPARDMAETSVQLVEYHVERDLSTGEPVSGGSRLTSTERAKLKERLNSLMLKIEAATQCRITRAIDKELQTVGR